MLACSGDESGDGVPPSCGGWPFPPEPVVVAVVVVVVVRFVWMPSPSAAAFRPGVLKHGSPHNNVMLTVTRRMELSCEEKLGIRQRELLRLYIYSIYIYGYMCVYMYLSVAIVCAISFEEEPLTRGALSSKVRQVEVDEAEFVATFSTLRFATNRDAAVARVQHARRRIRRHFALERERFAPSTLETEEREREVTKRDFFPLEPYPVSLEQKV